MKKITKQVKDNIVQVTIADERWYVKTDDNGNDIYVPSVTWVCGHYPKGVAFYKWLANHGWDEAEAIKNAAADKGSKIHLAIVDLINGEEVGMDRKYKDSQDGEAKELELEEYEALLSFAEWYKATKPKITVNEQVVFSDKFGYAGTVDLIAEIDGEKWIIDFKTGQYIWPEYELQLSAYRNAWQEMEIEKEEYKLAILQLGYRMNKRKYKFTEIKDKFNLFLSAREIWANETEGQKPLQKDLPLTIKL